MKDKYDKYGVLELKLNDSETHNKLVQQGQKQNEIDSKKVSVEVLLDGWQKCTYLVEKSVVDTPAKLEAFKQKKIEDYRLNEGRAHNMWNKKIE